MRTSLLTLNDALRTGNYTVLHDVGAPSFRKVNPANRLKQIFSTLVARRIDLTPVAVMVPKLSQAPSLDQQTGLLRISGKFLTRPMQINFLLLFQSVKGDWRLFGITVDPVSAPVAEVAPVTPAQTANAAKKATRDRPASVAETTGPDTVSAGAPQPPLPVRKPRRRR